MGKVFTRCPRCGSSNTAKIIYGYPLFNEEMQEKLDSGKWVLGGCCIDIAEINGETVSLQPAKRCNACKKDFGTAPILLDRKSERAEDYRNIVTEITLSVSGYFYGGTDITVKRNKNGAYVSVQDFRLAKSEEVLLKNYDHQLSEAEWNQFIETLYGRMYLHEWKKNYEDPCVLDGTQWNPKVKLTGGRKRTYNGSNDFPPYWEALLKLFKEVSGYAKL